MYNNITYPIYIDNNSKSRYHCVFYDHNISQSRSNGCDIVRNLVELLESCAYLFLVLRNDVSTEYNVQVMYQGTNSC